MQQSPVSGSFANATRPEQCITIPFGLPPLTETTRISEALRHSEKASRCPIKRNIERFPSNFRFQLSEEETIKLGTNCDRFETLKHSNSLPFVFTEQGVAMLSAVLRRQTAVHVSIQIMEAFVATHKSLDRKQYL